MAMTLQQITLDEWDVRCQELLDAGLDEPAYGGLLSRHIDDGDLRLLGLKFDGSVASLNLWNFLLTEEDRIKYVSALLYSEQYGKGEAVIRESANLFPANKYFARLHSNKDNFSKLFEDSAFYRIKPANALNSGKGDFGPSYFTRVLTSGKYFIFIPCC